MKSSIENVILLTYLGKFKHQFSYLQKQSDITWLFNVRAQKTRLWE